MRLVLEAARSCVPHPDRVKVAVAADLPPIWADHDRLEQVFVNLLENGVRHGGPDGAVRVTAAAVSGGTSVEVLVSDDGPGIPPEVAERIFEPRVRGEGSTGAGLGLAIVRGIAAAHGGRVELVAGPSRASA